jgi:hypothetical protein
MQLVADNRPLISQSVLEHLPERTTELTPTQLEVMPFEYYVGAYLQCFPQCESVIRGWEQNLTGRYGASLGIQHYVMHVQPKRPGPSSWTLSQNLAEKYGPGFAYPAESNRELALARAMENFVPAA